MPEIKFNGETRKLDSGSTAEVLLRQAGFEPASVILILNDDVVEKSALASTVLKDGDSVEILRLAGGG